MRIASWATAGLVGTCLVATATGASSTRAQDWTAFGGSPAGGQFSPLTEITPENVGRLKQAWIYHTGETGTGAPTLQINLNEGTPLHANETLYVCTRQGRVVALDPATGREKWAFSPQAAGLNKDPVRNSVCRGVAYWQAAQTQVGGACEKRVFRAATTESGARLYAVDADTGATCGDFGAGKNHAGYIAFTDFEWGGEQKGYVWVSSAPMVYGDLVIVGNSGLDNMQANSADGYVRAFDVRSGELKWSFTAIPPEMSSTTGASEVWAPFSIDTERGLVFLPTTSPSPDHWGGNRPDVPLANSVVAVKAETGEVVWHFQTIHHDLFDYDLPAQPILSTIEYQGQKRDVVIQLTKTGYVWVLDRATGEPVAPVKEMTVPPSDVPGEVASPTQPVPTWPVAFAKQTTSEDDIFGVTPIDKASCMRLFKESRYDGQFTPPSFKGSISLPGYLGGSNWGGATFDPGRQILVTKALNIATRIQLIRREEDEVPKPGGSVLHGSHLPMDGTPYTLKIGPFESPLGIPCTRPPWSTLTAIDMKTGQILWQQPFGQVKKNGITIPAFFGWGSPSTGGPISTASGLIFTAATADEHFRAIDIKTGRELWRFHLPSPGMAVPMSYRANGRQFLAIGAGSFLFNPTSGDDVIVAFTLDGKTGASGAAVQ